MLTRMFVGIRMPLLISSRLLQLLSSSAPRLVDDFCWRIKILTRRNIYARVRRRLGGNELDVEGVHVLATSLPAWPALERIWYATTAGNSM